MSKVMAVVAFVGVLILSGGNFGGAIIGALIVWAFTAYLWAPVKMERYDAYGNRDDNGPYTTPR